MRDLIEFLTARINEDEQMATAAGHGCGYLHEHNGGWVEVALPESHNARPTYEMRFIRTISPERVLADCASKRRIVTSARDYSPELEHGDNGSWAFEEVLRLLALPYATHKDYQQEWKP